MGSPFEPCTVESVIDDIWKQLTVERDVHIPKLAASAQMWRAARSWISSQASRLVTEAEKLTAADRWPDAAGQAFLQRATRDTVAMYSWVDRSGITGAMLSHGVPVASGPSSAQIFDSLDVLSRGIFDAQAKVEKLRDDYRKMSDEDKTKHLGETYSQIVSQLDALQPKYEAAAAALKGAQGQPWKGPRGVSPEQAGPSAGPGPATAPGPATPTSAQPAPGPAAPVSPSTPDSPNATDPWKAALEEAPNALDAASQALAGLQQLTGGGADAPSPTSPPSLSDLGSLTPHQVADRLSALGDSGLPSLASAGGPVGGGLSSAAPVPTPLSMSVPATADLGTTATTAAALTAGAGLSSSGAAAAASSPGMMPQTPANGTRAGKAASEIKPGDAEYPVSRSRSGKTAGTPGVPLMGRAGRRSTKPNSPAPRRWEPGPDTVQLLDEELWQPGKQESAPKHRAGH
ncbi:hypothetical protein [Amycolatopsis benzoatilytica]|uniref:hypothetical protein n=1 Tax=Amycolatopsis benzoatilytica TaxID=346045 RepID=UPI0003A213C5|nr:hypothetical protein [Amycolatopsis benzoatilytica]